MIRVEVEAPDRAGALEMLRAIADRFAEGEPETSGHGAMGNSRRIPPLREGIPYSHKATLEILEEGPRV
jgi:hypothetical protein